MVWEFNGVRIDNDFFILVLIEKGLDIREVGLLLKLLMKNFCVIVLKLELLIVIVNLWEFVNYFNVLGVKGFLYLVVLFELFLILFNVRDSFLFRLCFFLEKFLFYLVWVKNSLCCCLYYNYCKIDNFFLIVFFIVKIESNCFYILVI